MCGREAHERENNNSKKQKKNFYALFKLMLYECMLSDFFVCYSFILTEREKKLYTFEGHSFLSRSAMRGWSYDGSLCCAVWSLCFFTDEYVVYTRLQMQFCCSCAGFAALTKFDLTRQNQIMGLSRNWCNTRPWQSLMRDFHVESSLIVVFLASKFNSI